ncbi:MAG: oligopeptide:H+ symporter [Bifidobacteriaceae bacterium]|jgi:POT family proton-dependent oligopeptide transporter|nr:oligopeptide:H+ symporter [Bifidobacteriaceae bacterium]
MVKSAERDIMGQPRALFGLFWTEMFERFSFYGARAILFYFISDTILDGGLDFGTGTAMGIVSIYGACTYLFGLLGGYLADHVISASDLVLLGGVLISAGNFVIGLVCNSGGLMMGLLLIVLGTGMLKPNVTMMVGLAYGKNDIRRDAGFSILYMSINFGSLVAPLLVGFISESISYSVAFITSASAMVVGLLLYVVLKKVLAPKVGVEVPGRFIGSKLWRFLGGLIGGIGVFFGGLAWLTFSNIIDINTIISVLSLAIFLLSVFYIFWIIRSPKITRVERKNMFAFIPFFVIATFFYSIDEQLSSVMAEWTQDKVDLTIGSFDVPASWIQSVNPLLVLLFTPVIVIITAWFDRHGNALTTGRKFQLGVLLGGLSYLSLALIQLTANQQKYSLLVPILVILLLTVGEIFITPVGLALSTKLGPKLFSAQIVGVWFLADSCGQALNAQVTKFYDPDNSVGFFLTFALVGLAFALLLQIFHKKINSLTN